MSIEVQHVTKHFASFTALNDVSLKVESGELLALLGPSGSGKTTLLRILAGLEEPDVGTGRVLLQDEDVSRLNPAKRHVGFVFQHYALFKHMSVFENIAFGLRVQPRASRPSRGEINTRVQELLALVQLEGLAKRYPSQLSGGQRQRVALARAMAVKPSVLLLDEPFGALDAKVRKELRRWLRRLHDEIQVTTVFVTHDQEEAMEVADRVAILRAGRIEQIGTPDQVYDQPATPSVYDFLGQVNLFHGRVQDGRLRIGDATFDVDDRESIGSANATAYVRPHDVDVVRIGNGDTIPARVEHVSVAGPFVQVQLTYDGAETPIDVALPHERYRELDLKPSDLVYLKLRNPRVFAGDYSI